MAIKVQAAATHKVYHLWNQKFMWIFSGLIAFLLVPWQLATDTPAVLSALFLLSSVYTLWCAFTIRLVISPAGIAYDNKPVYSIVTSWSNVEQIAEIPCSSGGTFRALILREPAATGWPGLDAALRPEHRGRVIPLSGASWSQRRLWGHIGELEQEIQRHAPHVVIEKDR